MDEIRVMRFAPSSRPADNRGHRLLAAFECRARGVKLYGVGLWLHRDGFLTIGQPRAQRQNGATIGAAIVDHDLECSVIAAAHAHGARLDLDFPPLVLPLARPKSHDDDSGLRQHLDRHVGS